MHGLQEDLIDPDELDERNPPDSSSADAWPILIVDDEDEVHQVTRFVLKGTEILGRPLRFDSAYTADQARELLGAGSYACILLDVVMESEDAGLRLVGEIREQFLDSAVRIVLRTGQPGHAPELEVIRKYDINDYRSKSELTSQRLITTLTTALRSYQQIRTIEANREGLRMILDAASSLMAVKAVRSFASGVLTQICAMLDVDPEGVVCVRRRGRGDDFQILAAAGRHAVHQGQSLEALGNPHMLEQVQEAAKAAESRFGDDYAVLNIRSPRAEEMLVHISSGNPLREFDRSLLEVFSFNLAVGLDNAHLFEELEVMAFHDRLTGLWNRTSLERELARRIHESEAFAVVIADIDNFQAVNDGLGHDVGDRTLKASGALLAEVFGLDTYIARTSADSFAMIVQRVALDTLEQRLRALGKRLERNIVVEDHEIPLSMTLGIARFPEHGETATAVFQNAGIALKQAKRVSRASYQWFDDRFEQELQQRLQTVRELRYALERNALRLLYQPQIVLATGRMSGVEALARWQRDDDELLLPALFIAAAEDSGQIVAIGEWILREACRQQQVWEQATRHALTVAINVSMRQIKDADFPAMVRDVLRQTSIDPTRVELEVTESLMVDDSVRLVGVLEELRSTGVHIAIDDFGTGYSSLSQLQRLPIDRLKIDRAFITGLSHRNEDAVLAAMIINMGHLLGLRVIAEGVETAEQRDRLLQLGCDDAQGFLFDPPLPPDAIADRLHSHP
ncbi:MAG TPA: EAL domain-containing protein [Xanthomonadaceae bacterium]|nr:EAL domain-containing protein [Xanthomonadaceae bacterium]